MHTHRSPQQQDGGENRTSFQVFRRILVAVDFYGILLLANCLHLAYEGKEISGYDLFDKYVSLSCFRAEPKCTLAASHTAPW